MLVLVLVAAALYGSALLMAVHRAAAAMCRSRAVLPQDRQALSSLEVACLWVQDRLEM